MERYRLVRVSDYEETGRIAVWRHDVDLSPQAALAIGRIEAALGIRTTYYFNLHSEFYNLFEKPNTSVVRELERLGHEIGLHFDLNSYNLSDVTTFERLLALERNTMSSLLNIEVGSFSFHNPGALTSAYKAQNYAGLINAYCSELISRYEYCSDSNGYWRFIPLEEFLNMGHPAIYVLTHPGWWQRRPMSPRDRIIRSVEGRAAATARFYDKQLKRHGRKNIR
jgi:hypothetical protein